MQWRSSMGQNGIRGAETESSESVSIPANPDAVVGHATAMPVHRNAQQLLDSTAFVQCAINNWCWLTLTFVSWPNSCISTVTLSCEASEIRPSIPTSGPATMRTRSPG